MSTPFLKIKKRCLVYYTLPEQKRYNEASKKNLKQYEDLEKTKDEFYKKKLHDFLELQEQSEVNCINEFTKMYQLKYQEFKQKKFKHTFSIQQRKKISDSTNTFIDCIKHNYKKSNGFNQRMITFVTLTIPEKQKHTDKVLVKTLVDFIDHLKKVKNTLVQNKIDTGIELLKLENYVWRAETTELGNIHFHLLFDCYVNHTTLKRVWNNYLKKLGYSGGENAANIHNLKNIEDVGGYVTKYMTKQPLNDEFTKLLKEGQITHSQLDDYEDDVKFRRPVMYTSWGCSRDLKTLSAPTFQGSKVIQFNELRDKCQKVELNDEIKDYVKIYTGKIYDLLNQCGFRIKNMMKKYFKNLHHWLYRTDKNERNEEDKLIWLHSLPKPISESTKSLYDLYIQEKQKIRDTLKITSKPVLVMDSLF